MKAKRTIIVILVGVLLLAAGLGSLSFLNYSKSSREFIADGYILKPSEEVNVTTEVNEQYYFGQGTKYREKYETKILFKDTSGQDVSLDTEQFIHYMDGSLGAFTKGVIMNLDDLEEEQFGYYSLTKNTVLIKNGNVYEMSSRGEAMNLEEFVWKISDTDYMIVSPEVTLHMGDSMEVTFPDYAQIKYVDSGIVRIVHQQGTYQTVSADTILSTQKGAELNLVGKSFMVNGEPAVSLDSMTLDDNDSYIELDENTNSPELQIPTFNVIHGKDGAAGTDGEDGEIGEDGEDGQEGEEGTEGSEGTEGAAGAQGSNGINGEDGKDGVEGDSGIMGYDGVDGKSGQREDETGIVATDLNTRPTVTMDSEQYEITPGSVEMKLELTDTDGALNSGSTKVMLYDRATMKEVLTEEEAKSLGESLETTGSLVFNNNKLAPGTEYLVIVSGAYASEKDGSGLYEANLFTKVFKTDDLGVVLKKDVVTDTTINLKTEVSSTAIGTYSVVLYYYDEDGNKVEVGSYQGLSSSHDALLFDYASMTPDNIVKALEGNKVYYASLANVSLAGTSQLMPTDGTELKIQTLKTKPYKSDDPNVPITEMQPTLTTNEKSHTITMTLDPVTDPHSGVQKYRYELYKASDVALTPTLSALTPAYSVETDSLQTQTFNIPADDLSAYVGRVVAVFDDNEKTVEYSTLLSTQVNLSASSFPIVEIVDVNKTADAGGNHDKLSGYIMVKDAGNMLVPNVSTTYPIVVTISSEYEKDIFTLKLTEADTTKSTADATYYYFEQDNLRKNTTYSFSVSGPVDIEGGGIQDTEQRTYLTGGLGTTTGTYGLRAVFTSLPTTTAAFSKRINFTAGASSVDVTDSEGTVTGTISIGDEFYKYETETMDSLVLELVHVLPSGTQKVMGEPYKIKDTDPLTHDSIFFDGGWVDYSAVKQDGASSYLTTDTPNTGSDALILTPQCFGLDNNDAEFYSGGTFIIRVKQATDYTTIHQNVIPFVEGENATQFEIKKKHVQAVDPTKQVKVATITNSSDTAATDGYNDTALDDDTVVGLMIQANYDFGDAKEITYQVYRLKDDETSPDEGGSKNIYASSYDASEVAAQGGVQAGELVCEYTITGLQGDSGAGNADPIKLYFKDLAMKSEHVSPSSATWTNKTSEIDLSKVMTRGGRYFITYTVKGSENEIYGYSCDHVTGSHYYPACAYASGELVPYYRSTVVEIGKQVPKVERYPVTSDENSITWNYKISDPDGAIAADDSGNASINVIPYGSYDGAAGTPTTQSVAVASYASAFANLQLTGLTDGKYYAVEIPYKLLTADTAETKTITSIPVQFKAKVSSISGIELKGPRTTDTSLDRNNDGYEDALINQGGYQYRLTVRGENVSKLAALRVTFTGKDTSGNTLEVVYDPVHLDLQLSTIEDGGTYYPYAYAYMDTSALSNMDPTATTTVKVEGYYNTNVAGVNAYNSVQEIGDSKKNLKDENVYALQMIDSAGAGNYVYQSGTAFISSPNLTGQTGSVVKSLFVPGSENEQAGFDEAAKTLGQRYAFMPLVLLSENYLTAKGLSIEFDQNGMMDTSSSKYIMTEQLALQELTFSISADASVQLGDTLPAVEKAENASAGVTSILLKLEAKGTGASESSKIYAEILEKNGSEYKVLDVTVEQQSRADGDVWIYKAVSADDATRYVADADKDTYFAQGSYGSKYIPIEQEESKLIVPLRIQGLNAGTDYRMIMFTYDANGDRQDLYSIDGKRIGYPYEVKTKTSLDIDTDGPAFVYSSYSDKSATFGFGVPGDEGTGMIATYWVEDGSGNKVIAEATLSRLGDENYWYYSTDKTKNNRMKTAMTPGGALALNTTYTLKISVASEADGEILGTKDVTFTTPDSLKAPSFMVQATPQASSVAGKSDVKVTVVCTDKEFTVMGDSYEIIIKTKDGSEVTRKTVSKSGEISTVSETFNGLDQNTSYTIEVVANTDLDNNSVADSEPVKRVLSVTTTPDTSATLGANATAEELNLRLSKLVNFDDVDKVLITAFKDGTTCYSEEVPLSSFTAGSGEYSINLAWGTQESGDYVIQIQYRDASGGVLGDGEVTASVAGTSILNLFSSPKSSDTASKESTKTTALDGKETDETKTTTDKSTDSTTGKTDTTGSTTGTTTDSTSGTTTGTTGTTTSTTTDSTTGSATDSTSGTTTDSTSGTTTDSTSGTTTDSTSGTTTDSTSGTTTDSTSGTTTDSTSGTTTETTTEPTSTVTEPAATEPTE